MQYASGAKPTLLIVPPNLVNQWIKAIQGFTADIIIKVYHGARNRSFEGLEYIDRLTQDHPLFCSTREESVARTVIISTYLTLTCRHGPTALRNYRIRRTMQETPDLKKSDAKKLVEKLWPFDTPDRSWECDLCDRFERVILDEGHEIRNESTRSWITIRWLNCTYKIIVTATPTLNSISDFVGLMGMLEPNDDIWNSDNLRDLGVTNLDEFDPWKLSEEDPAHILRFTARGLRDYVFDAKLTKEEIGLRMRHVFKKCLLKRSYGAKVDGKVIGDDLPPAQCITIEVNLNKQEREQYDTEYRSGVQRLFRMSKGRIIYDTSVYRRLCLVTSWLGFKWLLHYKVKELKEFHKTKGDARRILCDMRAEQVRNGEIPLEVPPENDIQRLLQAHAEGSPKLRYLLLIIAELVVLKKEKLIIWVMLPAQMTWLEKVSFCTNADNGPRTNIGA
jgi:hypothetical protein